MSTKYTDGLPVTDNHDESAFGIYRNALDFVMSNLSLDEDAAAEVILGELGGYADEWQKHGIQSAAKEIKATRLPQQTVDWGRAWLN